MESSKDSKTQQTEGVEGSGDASKADILPKTESDLQDPAEQGLTGLHLAASQGNFEKVEDFLEDGANQDATNDSDSTALHYAAKHGHDTIAQILLDFFANPNAQDNHQRTPLHYAAKHGHDKTLQILFDFAANPNAQDNYKRTPLHYAVEFAHYECVLVLLKAGANQDLQDQEGQTVYHKQSDEPILNLLLKDDEEIAATPGTLDILPRFPISINGNALNRPINPAADATHTKHILIQTRSGLSLSQRQDLADSDVVVQDYVCNNTHICYYAGHDINRIRNVDGVVYVDIYRAEFKIEASLKHKTESQDIVNAEIILHHAIATDITKSEDLKAAHDKQLQDCCNKVRELVPHCEVNPRPLLGKTLSAHNTLLVTLPGNCLEKLTTIDEVRTIEELHQIELQSNYARVTLGLDVQAEGNQDSNSPYKGEGQVIAIADSGIDCGTTGKIHHAFGNRVVNIHSAVPDFTGHGTHVCGLAVGDGIMANTHIRGTAPAAKLVVQSSSNKQQGGMQNQDNLYDLFKSAYIYGARVHSNSWVSIDKSSPNCHSENALLPRRYSQNAKRYSQNARHIDTFVYRQQDMVICFAAGNYASYHAETGQLLTGQIGEEAAAKNCITVGACESSRQDITHLYKVYDQSLPQDIQSRRMTGNDSLVAAFSSRGPFKATDAPKSRMKPDVVAPGTFILSANSSVRANKLPQHYRCDEDWCYMSGTSMATPLVAGCAALLREALIKKGIFEQPSAAIIKALVINGADPISEGLPNEHSGFGRVNLRQSMNIACGNEGTAIHYDLLKLKTDEFHYKVPVLSQSMTLKITLVWLDPPGPSVMNRPCIFTAQGSGNPERAKRQYNTTQQVILENLSLGEVKVIVRCIEFYCSFHFAIVWRLYSSVK